MNGSRGRVRSNVGFLLAALLCAPGFAAAATLFVAPTGSDGNTCLAPDAPCATLQSAVDKASPGDVVRVGVGAYIGSAGASVVTLGKDLTLDGGWDPTFAVPYGLSDIGGQNQRRGVHVLAGVSATVRRFVIRNGYAVDRGGGIRSDGTLTVEHCSLRDNFAALDGGGIYLKGGSLIVRDSAVIANVAGQVAGGIYAEGAASLSNTTIAANRSPSGGGLVRYEPGSLALRNVTITGNQGQSHGGLAVGGPTTVRNSVIAGNRAARSGLDCTGTITALDYSLIGDATGCTLPAGAGNLTAGPAGLGPPIGQPEYVPVAAASPLVNAGDPAGCADAWGPLAADQRGAPRAGRCDIGAYEFHDSGPPARILVVTRGALRTARGSLFARPVEVAMVDALGSPVAGVDVTFTAPATGATATFHSGGTTASVPTDAFGIASAVPRAGNVDGWYVVDAVADEIPGVAQFALVNSGWFVALHGSDGNTCDQPGSSLRDRGRGAAQARVPAARHDPARAGDLHGHVAAGRDHPEPRRAPVRRLGHRVPRPGRTVHGHGPDVRPRPAGERVRGGARGASARQRGAAVRAQRRRHRRGRRPHPGGFRRVGGPRAVRGRCSRQRLLHAGPLAGRRQRRGEWGGGIDNDGYVVVRDSAFVGNSAERGGGVRNQTWGKLFVENSTFAGNTAATFAGAIHNFGGRGRLSNVTIVGNSAGSAYGGVSGPLEAAHTLIAGNTAPTSPDCSGLLSRGYNLVGDASGCTLTGGTGDQLGVDPELGPLLGMPPYHPLVPGSPAIDAGDPADVREARERCRPTSGARRGRVPATSAPTNTRRPPRPRVWRPWRGHPSASSRRRPSRSRSRWPSSTTRGHRWRASR